VKQVKVVTSSELKRVPARKAVFRGGIVEGRWKAKERAIKYKGWSHIYGPDGNIGNWVLLEKYDRDGGREVIRD
jgi:hypothetical protein